MGSYPGGVQYLSAEWLRRAGELVAASESLRSVAGEVELVVEYAVSGAPGGDVTYQLALGGGSASLSPGSPREPTVRMSTDYATASSVAAGRLSAQLAFMEGRVRLGGDVAALLAASGALGHVDDVLAPLRPTVDA